MSNNSMTISEITSVNPMSLGAMEVAELKRYIAGVKKFAVRPERSLDQGLFVSQMRDSIHWSKALTLADALLRRSNHLFRLTELAGEMEDDGSRVRISCTDPADTKFDWVEETGWENLCEVVDSHINPRFVVPEDQWRAEVLEMKFGNAPIFLRSNDGTSWVTIEKIG